jgi:hypothetical protein
VRDRLIIRAVGICNTQGTTLPSKGSEAMSKIWQTALNHAG